MTNAQGHTLNWPRPIQRNRNTLLRIIAVLFVYAGLNEGGADDVPRRVWRMVLRLLRPAAQPAFEETGRTPGQRLSCCA